MILRSIPDFLPSFARTETLNPNYILDICRGIESFVGSKKLTYLEVGAFDGIFQSNTLAINQQLGWSGILVEPVASYYEACKKNRPDDIVINAALGSYADCDQRLALQVRGPMSFLKHPSVSNALHQKSGNRLLTSALNYFPDLFRKKSVLKTEFVAIVTVDEVVSKYNIQEISFASIDVEGFEFDVLNGMDLFVLKNIALLVEVRPHNLMKITDRLIGLDYVLVDSLSRFNLQDNPNWDGSHQDYLFLKREFVGYLSASFQKEGNNEI